MNVLHYSLERLLGTLCRPSSVRIVADLFRDDSRTLKEMSMCSAMFVENALCRVLGVCCSRGMPYFFFS